jgi:hypothetical protein
MFVYQRVNNNITIYNHIVMVIFIPKTKRHERFDSSPDAAEDAVESGRIWNGSHKS